ncbi:uncharacterized protein MKZ38_009165 [Zalerion maritima]|uniref:Uncharacterized protein n=1 Tax=Zalerion maritima TaxID=339359 RepID=A0AAD5WNA3_9PEZI|nr:uncharacterized protein MKZ38_009165 [Zalerion maritima]
MGTAGVRAKTFQRYHFERIFLKEALINGARTEREDEEGNRRREEELEEIRKVRYEPGTLMQSGEYEVRMRHFNLREKGWTQEQIDAEERDPEEYERQEMHNKLRGKGWTQKQIDAADRADAALWEWQRRNPQPRGSGVFGLAITQEERNVYDAWLHKERAAKLRIYGLLPPMRSGPFGQYIDQENIAHDAWGRNIHARVSSQQGLEPEAGTTDASAIKQASQLRAPRSRATKDISRKTRSGRIEKNAPQRQSGSRRGT